MQKQENAAHGGHLDVLKWAREHHSPWNGVTCACAFNRGHMDVLMWAREHDCPWNEWTCARAAFSAPLEVLQWAMEHGAPVFPHHSQWYVHLLRGEPHSMDRYRAFRPC